MSYSPNRLLLAIELASSLRALTLMPGIVMCPPIRYTPRMAKVNSSLSRSSLIAKMLRRLSMPLRQDLGRPAGRRDLLGRLPAELVRTDSQRLGDLPTTEHLDGRPAAADDAALAQQVGRDRRSGVEHLGQRIEIDHGVFDAERVLEPALGQPAMQRHLAALEAALGLVPRARLRALVTARRRLAMTRSRAPAHALLGVLGAARWAQVVQRHVAYSSMRTRCRTLRIRPRVAGVSSISTVCRIRRRPRPRRACAWSFAYPIELFSCVTLSRFIRTCSSKVS